MRIINDESSRHGAAMPRRRLRDGGHVQGGGAVWRRGGVDGRSDMVNALIAVLKMGERKTAAATSGVCTSVCAGVCWTYGDPCSLVGGLVWSSVFG